jgi:anti-sigma B factor antagonist
MDSTRHSHAHAAAPFALTEGVLDGSGVPVIEVRGELDLFTAPELRERLLRHFGSLEPDHLVVDLAQCAFVDASGCHALLTAARRLAAHDRRLVLVNTHDGNARIFSVMGFDELFPIVASRAAAAAALRQRAP